MSAETYIDGTLVPNVLEGSVTRRLNLPWQAGVRIPLQYAIGAPGSRLKIVLDGTLWFHGRVMTISDEAGEDTGYSQYEAADPMELWRWRPARDLAGEDPGNFIDPSFMQDYVSGPQILQSILQASENPSGIPETAEGPLFISYGSFETGGNDLSGGPTNWPMSIAEIASLLTSTGEVDIVLTPIDSGGNMARLDVYNGDYGTNRSGSVIFSYATGNHNVRELRQVEDMSNVTNKLQYFLRRENQRHFDANITGDDPCLPGNATAVSEGDGGPGGALPGRPQFAAPGDLGHRRAASQAAYGVRFEPQLFDTDPLASEPPVPGTTCGDPVQIYFRRRWQLEHWIRCQPRRLVHISPVRVSDNMQLPPGVTPVQVGDFDIGDIVGVEAGASVRGGFSGAQRIFEYTVNWDEDGVFEINELVTSPTQEGF